jgi:DNA-directed RNA polymerase specialized sigma24 family protein
MNCTPPTSGQARRCGAIGSQEGEIEVTSLDGDEILRHVPYMRRHAALVCLGDRDRADRLVERTLVGITENPDRWDGQDGSRVILFRAMQHVMREDAFVVPQPTVDAGRAERISPSTSPAARTGDDAIDDAFRWLARMPLEQRTAFLLVAIEGLSPAETAAVLETDMANTEALCAEARDHLEGNARPLGRSA